MAYIFIRTDAACIAPKTANRLLDRYLRNEFAAREREWIDQHLERCPRCEILIENHKTVELISRRFRIPPENVREIAQHLTVIDLETGSRAADRGTIKKKPAR